MCMLGYDNKFIYIIIIIIIIGITRLVSMTAQLRWWKPFLLAVMDVGWTE